MLWRNPFWDVERMMEDFWGDKGFPVPTRGVMMPTIDMFKENGNLVVNVDMPGVEKDDIALKLVEDCLCVSAQKKHFKEEKREGFYKSERMWKSYGRTIRLSTNDKDEYPKPLLKNDVE